MSLSWQALGLKPEYETGELIILNQVDAPSLDASTKIYLSPSAKPEKILLQPKLGPGNKIFFEFYALEAGNYELQASWGTSTFSVVPRRDLSFQIEFGIFFIVVAIVVISMAWRYLRSPRIKREAS